MTLSKTLISLTLLVISITGCGGKSAVGSADVPAVALPTREGVVMGQSILAPRAAIPAETERTASASPKVTSAPTLTLPPTAIPSATATQTPEPSPTVSATATPTTVLPSVEKLRGKVIIDQAVCHYGPGAPYLYKYGVYRDSNLELLRRVEGGNYVEIQAIGGNNPCWVRVDYFEIKGNWLDLQPVRFDDTKLPISPYYASPGGVSARRDGDEVTVFWNALVLRAGDDSEQTPYIVEAWVCQNGQNVFVPAGTYQGAVKIVDEAGCAEPSYAYFIAAEKHGYTGRVAVPWPQQE